jgi:cellobiose phosphorylase
MYRLILESLLGVRLEADRLHIAPCLPAHWEGLKIHYRYRKTVYHIAIVQNRAGADEDGGVTSVVVDGVEQHSQVIPLLVDRREHTVVVTVRANASLHVAPVEKRLFRQDLK